jgi:predicted AAA+ superfamily ATPase
MPQVIETFLSTNNYESAYLQQMNIVYQYKNDFIKYEFRQNKLSIERVYDSIISQLQKEYNRYELNDIKKDLRFLEIENQIDWLIRSNCAYRVDLCGELRNGIQLSQRPFFKLYLSDVGLLVSQLGRAARNAILIDDKKINLGFVYENFACQELVKIADYLHYYHPKKQPEIEFVIESKELLTVLPIEIKSGSDYKLHKGVSKAMET